MGRENSGFKPEWLEQAQPPKSYRSIFKWGDPQQYKHPNARLYQLMKQTFNMSDDDFRVPENLGLEEVSFEQPTNLQPDQIEALVKIVGPSNARLDDYSRLEVAYGKTMLDLMRLRQGIVENIPDLVLYPRDKEDIAAIVRYCHEERIPVYIYGGGSSVTRGVECVQGGVSLDMRVHMNKVLEFNEINQTITVEPGMYGPQLENKLTNAQELFGAKKAYTCGHFPQSFEYSTVGGWVVTRGAGQNSTYYGKIEDLVVCQEYVTPVGTILTKAYPAAAIGPSIDEIMLGSEGAYGVLVAVTLKIFRYLPQNQQKFGYIFKNWSDALAATREIMQAQFGYPSVFRLSDPEETDIALKLYGVEGTIIDKVITLRGYKPNERCLLIGLADGEAGFAKLVAKKIQKICQRQGAMSTTGYVTKEWEKGRFKDPYLRDDLQDYGIMTDTLECAVAWDKLEQVHEGVRKFCKSRPDTICMTHISHFYPQGANLYFIFIAKINEIPDYLEYQRGILDSIQQHGASMSHHHGIGKMTAPWLEKQLGKNELEVYRAIKRHFDPHNIMNPGGTLALDLPDEQRRG